MSDMDADLIRVEEESRAFWAEWYPPDNVFLNAVQAEEFRRRYMTKTKQLPGTCSECGWEGDVAACPVDPLDGFPRCKNCGGMQLTWDEPAAEADEAVTVRIAE